MQKVYKVVDPLDGRLMSCGIYGKHEQEYTPGEWKDCPHMFVCASFAGWRRR